MLWLALIAAAGPPTHLYHVDLSRAVVATPEGQALRARLDASRQGKQGRLHAERERLLTRRGRMSEAAYSARVEQLNARIEAAERLLEEEQRRGLEPLLAGLDEALAKLGALEPSARTVALEDVSLIVPRRLCDRTGWLAQAARSQKVKAPGEIGACKLRAVATARVDEAVAKTKLAQVQLAKLRKLQDERQAEIDRFRRALTELAAKARREKDGRMATEAAHQKRDLDARYTRYQAQIEGAERAAQGKLRDAVESAVAKAQKAHPQVVFVQVEPGAAAPEWAVGCDATAWLTQAIDGGSATLPAGCARAR